MITQNELKLIKSLSQRKFRQKYNKFVAEGDKICAELLFSESYQIAQIYCTNEWYQEHVITLSHLKHIVTLLSAKDLARASLLSTANEVIMVLHLPSGDVVPATTGDTIIYLDDVQDPGNVGTIIRIADWYGISQVVRSSGTADFYSPKVVQATMASFANVILLTSPLEVLRQANPQHECVGAVLGGNKLESFTWPAKCIIIMGNESRGVGEKTLSQLQHRVMISGSNSRLADSLNVAIAAALMCQDWYKSK